MVVLMIQELREIQTPIYFVDASEDRTGIGTSSPSAKLDIVLTVMIEL